MSGPSHGRHREGSTRKGAEWPQGAETSLCGLRPSWSSSGLAGLSQTADCVEKTSSRLRLVPLVCQPILVSSAAAETPLCLLGLGKGLERRQRSFGACPSLHVGSQPFPCMLLAQGCGGSWLAAAWHHPTWLSLIAQCSRVSPGFPAKAEMSQTPLSCSRTCQDLQVTAGWAQVGWRPVPGLCCSRSWGGTSYVSVAQEGWLKRPRLQVGE